MKIRLLQYLEVKNIFIKGDNFNSIGSFKKQAKLDMLDLLTYMDFVLMLFHVAFPLAWSLPRSKSCDTFVQVMHEQLKWTLLVK
jgi:hypothetical protein